MAVDDSYTKALLHMDGADASTTFIDESGKTWTTGGQAQIDTAQYKFGGASGLFDPAISGDYIDTPDSADFDFGSGDFTIDFWTRVPSIASNMQFLGQGDSAANNRSIDFYWNSVIGIVYNFWYDASNFVQLAVASSLSINTWTHFAYVRNGNIATMYVNGNSGGTADLTGRTAYNSANKLAIGRLGEYNGVYLNGWIDEVRISKGIARWTSNFTPPARPYATPRNVISAVYLSDYGVM